MKIIDINGSERTAKKAFLDPNYPGYVRVDFRRHHEWYSIKEFLKNNPNMKDVVKGAKETAPDITGTVTQAKEKTLKDDTQNFSPNEYMDYHVWISRGHGEGQVRSVIKNTKDTLTINKAWDTKPNTTSQYVVASEIDEDMKSMGNTLPIEDMKKLEEKAIKMDIKKGLKPAERKYTKDKDN